GEPKETEGSALFQIYQAFASEEETAQLRQAYADGIAWGDAKQLLFERIDREIAPMRARYQHLMEHPQEVEAILQAGAQRAREMARPFMAELRHAVGLRALAATAAAGKPDKTARAALPAFKQYREPDGRHYFKLVDAGGRLLLQSEGFDSPREAGQAVARLKQEGTAALDARMQRAPDISTDELAAALALLAETR
ncbi:MAG TPA: tryptophan--tRNA ligase, partial [Ramlibacter sp.]|nr:tryptophan--tRNA ligase [Ramlibacter sp.]